MIKLYIKVRRNGSMFLNIRKMKKKNMKFGELANKWLDVKKLNIKESTYSHYVYYISKYLIPEFEDYKIKKLSSYNFNKFVEKKSETLSPKTVRDIICILKSILYFAEDECECDIKIKKIVSPKLNQEPLTILNKREKTKLEKYCLKENTLESLGIIICLNTGLRIGEICALKWENIDLEKRELKVKSTLQRIYTPGKNRTKIIIDKPKTKTSVRVIPITTKIYDILIGLKDQYFVSDFFLTGTSDSYLEPRRYRIKYQRILEECNMKKYKFHILRHTFATNCIEVGMDIKTLSEILGHSSVEITLNRYVHSSYKIKKKYLEKL